MKRRMFSLLAAMIVACVWGCGPSLKSSDWHERLRAVESLTD